MMLQSRLRAALAPALIGLAVSAGCGDDAAGGGGLKRDGGGAALDAGPVSQRDAQIVFDARPPADAAPRDGGPQADASGRDGGPRPDAAASAALHSPPSLGGVASGPASGGGHRMVFSLGGFVPNTQSENHHLTGTGTVSGGRGAD